MARAVFVASETSDDELKTGNVFLQGRTIDFCLHRFRTVPAHNDPCAAASSLAYVAGVPVLQYLAASLLSRELITVVEAVPVACSAGVLGGQAGKVVLNTAVVTVCKLSLRRPYTGTKMVG